MIYPQQILLIKEIFDFAQKVDRSSESQIYIDSLDTFLVISSFVLSDKQLYPHWVSEININSILEVCSLVPANGGSRLYINEMVYYYPLSARKFQYDTMKVQALKGAITGLGDWTIERVSPMRWPRTARFHCCSRITISARPISNQRFAPDRYGNAAAPSRCRQKWPRLTQP